VRVEEEYSRRSSNIHAAIPERAATTPMAELVPTLLHHISKGK
jgi:hypothetical protein